MTDLIEYAGSRAVPRAFNKIVCSSDNCDSCLMGSVAVDALSWGVIMTCLDVTGRVNFLIRR